MTVKGLLDELKQLPTDTTFKYGFSGSGYSYRGDYSQVAFIKDTDVNVSTMIDSLESVVGKTFTGYKGGEFTMDEYTDVYIVDDYDMCGTLADDYVFNLWLVLSY
jgi:hypothetical protein